MWQIVLFFVLCTVAAVYLLLKVSRRRNREDLELLQLSVEMIEEMRKNILVQQKEIGVVGLESRLNIRASRLKKSAQLLRQKDVVAECDKLLLRIELLLDESDTDQD